TGRRAGQGRLNGPFGGTFSRFGRGGRHCWGRGRRGWVLGVVNQPVELGKWIVGQGRWRLRFRGGLFIESERIFFRRRSRRCFGRFCFPFLGDRRLCGSLCRAWIFRCCFRALGGLRGFIFP